MIELTMEDLLLWMLGVPLISIGIYSLFSALRTHKTEKKESAEISSCRICGHLFRERRRDKIVDCPACGCKTERARTRRLG